MIEFRTHPQIPTDAASADEAIERAVRLASSVLCESHFQGYQLGLAVRGARCESFRLHHSLPHRAPKLQAQARHNVAAPPPAP
ncbi:MAG: hypothetical protein WD011_01985, partial [Nitriliruptoraceae bacterium]